MVDLSERNVKRNMILGAGFKGLSMLISYLYVPIILMCLGEVKYGIWTTILNVLSWINYFDIGIGNGLRNKLAESLASEIDSTCVRKYVSSAYILLGIIVLCVATLACVLSSYINWGNVFGVDSFDEDLTLIMQLSIVFVAINFWLSLCKSILYALQKNGLVNALGVAQQLIMLVSVVLVTKFKIQSILVIAFFYGLSNFLVMMACNTVLCIKDKKFVPRMKYFSKKEAKETTGLGVLFFIVQISALILFTTDNLLISHFIGPAEVTSYSIVQKLFSMGTAVFVVLVAPYWSRTSGARAQGDYKVIKESIKKMYILLGMGTMAVIALVFVFRPIADWWLGQKLIYRKGIILLMAIYSIIYMWNSIYSQIANGLSMMKIIVPVAIAQGIVNIPLSLFFLLHYDLGVVGVLLGTVIATLIAAVIVPIFVHKEINQRMRDGDRV